MRKIVITFCLFYLVSFGLYGQWNNLRIGIQLSPNMTSLNTDDPLINSNGSNFGIKFGTTVEWYLSETISLHTGLNIAFNQGGNVLHDLGGDLLNGASLSNEALHNLPEGINIRYNTQQVELPLGIRYRTKERKERRYFIDLPGLNIGFRTKATAKLKGSNINTGKEKVNNTQLVNLSYHFGAGIELSLTEDISLQTGIIYQQTFADFIRNSGEKFVVHEDYIEVIQEDSFTSLRQISWRIAILF